MRLRLVFAAGCVFLLAAAVGAQKRFALTIENIMRGPELVGYPPAAPRWSGDSERIYFDWKQPSEPVLDPLRTYVVQRDGSGLRKLSDEEARQAPPAAGDESRDKTRIVFVREGDVFLYDRQADRTRQVTRTAEVVSNPHFTRDGKRVWFTRSNNLYVLWLEDGALEQLTEIGPTGVDEKRGGEDKRGTDSQEFLKKEERDLLDVVRQRAKLREEQEARKKREHPRKPMKLDARQRVESLALSPDEKTVLAAIAEPSQEAKTTFVPNFVTESGYTEEIGSRGKAGDQQGRMRMALIGVIDGEVKWVDHGQRMPAGAEPEKQEKRPAEAPDRDVRLQSPEWSGDGTRCVLIARSADHKDRWILALDPLTGKTRVIFADHDDAWVDGPGSSTLGWMKGDREIYFESERDGYAHLYTAPFEGGDARQLTAGKWEVSGVRLSNDGSSFYLTTNEGDPAQVHLYSMPAGGGPRTRVTTLTGGHHGVLSPDEKWIADIYSYTNRPPELFAMENRPGAEEKKLTSSPAPEFWTYPWLDAPLTHFRARDGVDVPVRLYKPKKVAHGGPAVIFVHGAGYLQNVHHWWSYYDREYMFNQLLAEEGYLVIDIDYRGSAGYGRDWRTAIYRHMGGKDLDDHVDAARWLVSQFGVDPKKIGIYGGSYGGFITLMALFREPDVFRAGAALRPVTDWAHYNHGYTTSILNLPQKDAEAYKQSSPIYFANGLKGALLICHGMADTNVHFQDTVLLVEKLIELGKPNWDLAVYPAEDHGFVQPSSWTDEYKRIHALFEKNLK